MTAADEAKQLDSVTDVVKEEDFDVGKAHSAMSALASAKAGDSDEQQHKIVVSKEDVNLIVEQLEVTKEEAERVLRDVSAKKKPDEEQSTVFLALKKLITST